MKTTLRRANIADVEAIQKLINHFAALDKMLPRSLNELYENLRDFYIISDDDELIGCCALHLTWADLAEVKGLAIQSEHQGKNLGEQLVHACLDDARQLGVSRIFVLTYIPDYFSRFGFKHVDKADLPQKVWSECIRCPKFPDCGEVSMIMDL